MGRAGADGDGHPSGPTGTIPFVVSVVIALTVDELTGRAALIAALAVVALVAAGWRKPARAASRSPRGPLARLRPGDAPPAGVPVVRLPTEPHHRVGPLRRLFSLAATGVVAVTTGAVIAVILAVAAVLAVIGLTDLLGR